MITKEATEAAKKAAPPFWRDTANFEKHVSKILTAALAAMPVQGGEAQCCMCGKIGLSTVEGDGGAECELSDGRWVCSSDCWDRAVELAPSLAAENERLRAALDGLRKDMDRCEHDGGYDREIGQIGCCLGDKCVCMPLYMKINAALEDRT